jgi:hypothetical protein
LIPAAKVWWERTLAAGLIAVIVGFYAWLAAGSQADPPPWLGPKQLDYENLLMHGFIKGHLYLNVAPDPWLVRAENPYDPEKRPASVAFLHDGSYYRGHYYIYFGVTPVVTLLLPWQLVTGHDLPQPYAILIFVSLGFLTATALWLAVRRRYFPDSGTVVLLAGIAALGLSTMTYALLRRPSIWEEPIASGYFYAMLALFGLYRGLVGRRPGLWLAMAGLSLGLAVGSRPTYVVGAVAFLAPLIVAWRRRQRSAAWAQAMAMGLPFAAVLAGLLWYNQARFGNPFEFGNHYEISSLYEAKIRHFSPDYLKFNLDVYYLAPALWSRYFPFIQAIHPPIAAAGHLGAEYAYGLFTNFPFVCVAFLAPLAWWRRPAEEREILGALVGTWVAFEVAVGGLVALFLVATARYMVDFAPALVLLACLGLLGVERATIGWRRAVVRTLAAAGAVFGAFVSLMLSFQMFDLVLAVHPDFYRRTAHAFDRPAAWFERRTQTPYGEIDLTLIFPRNRAGQAQPLVTTGWDWRWDRLFVRYLDDHHLSFELDHPGGPLLASAPIAIDYGAEHHLRVQMGSLFPPAGHPFYDGLSPAASGRLTQGLRVVLDGTAVFDQARDFYTSSPGNLQIGTDGHDRFGGQILAIGRPDPRGAEEVRH